MDIKAVARDNEGEKGQGESRAKGPDKVGEPEIVDFLHLLRLLRISLPEGIMTDKVIEISKTEQSVKYAETLIQDLEDFKLVFKICPRLGNRKVKSALALKEHGKVLNLTKLIFFEKNYNDNEVCQEQWNNNTSNTGHGFKLRERYTKKAISTPLMYSTAITRSWKPTKAGTDSPRLTEGKVVKTVDIENIKFAEEKFLWTANSKKFGKNDADENESLKFYLGLSVTLDSRKACYTKGNRIEYGFLKGTLDFLAECINEQGKKKRVVIECKSTEGDMVDKFYTKIPKSQKAQINKDHMYSIQVQTYLYILDELAKIKTFDSVTSGVIILRHYHKDCEPLRDFHLATLKTDKELHNKIDSLRVFCQEEVLGCFLAVLNLIFEENGRTATSHQEVSPEGGAISRHHPGYSGHGSKTGAVGRSDLERRVEELEEELAKEKREKSELLKAQKDRERQIDQLNRDLDKLKEEIEQLKQKKGGL